MRRCRTPVEAGPAPTVVLAAARGSTERTLIERWFGVREARLCLFERPEGPASQQVARLVASGGGVEASQLDMLLTGADLEQRSQPGVLRSVRARSGRVAAGRRPALRESRTRQAVCSCVRGESL